jgi:hypothetical protein
MNIPYNTGKVKIGSNYTKSTQPMSQNEEMIQRVLIDKTPIEPEDIMHIIYYIIRLFFNIAAMCLLAGIFWSLVTHKLPEKPVPDCGSCKVYKEGVKK